MRRWILVTGLSIAVFLSGCSTKPVSMKDIKKEPPKKESKDVNWKDIELKDVKSGKKFKVSDFKGKSVLLESFAVWCPQCRKQQDEIKEFHQKVDGSVVSISVDTDPNEDKKKVIEHLDRYGYDWLFAVGEKGFAQKLIDEFGVNVVNAPATPVILICEDQKSRLLKFGIKKADNLKEEIDKGCE